jgi:DNA repair exonuclease SbcCD ATPase subunit
MPDTEPTSSLQNEHEFTHEIDRLKLSNLLLRDQVSLIKAEARSYCDEITSLNRRLQTLESQALQDTPALIVGREVRLRYLEHHRQRMGHAIKQGYDWGQSRAPRAADDGCNSLV